MSLVHITNRRATVRDDTREVDFILSTNIEDRAGDTIDQSGWLLENYLKNPVVLWSHNHDIPAIGVCSNVRIDGGNLCATVRFASAAEHEFADTVYKLVKGGFINSGSVGFLPRRFEIRDRGLAFIEQELIEFTICNVPMNPQALAKAVVSGIDIAPLAKATGIEVESPYDAVRSELIKTAAAHSPRVSMANCRNRHRALGSQFRLRV